MAAGKKDEKAEKVQADETAVAEARKKKKRLLMFIGLAFLLVLISAGATFFVVAKVLGKNAGQGEDGSESSRAEEVVAAPAIYYPLKPNFTVNYDVNGRQRFLQAELTLMYRDEAVKKIFEDHMPEVRNGLVMLLSSQVFDELQTGEGKEKLRAAALKTVQDIISKETAAIAERAKAKDGEKSKEQIAAPNIEQVLFTQFVMQ